MAIHSKMSSWCLTPDCPFVFTYDEDIKEYKCPVCKKHYCLNCKCIFHHGQSCGEYRVNNTYTENDKQF